jgi:hypothetical protein
VPISTGVVGPDGCLYGSGSDTIYRLSLDDGTCPFRPTSPAPALALTPAPDAPDREQGESQLFEARLLNVESPLGTPVYFGVTGANSGFGFALADAEGVAAFDLVGVFEGTDGVSAAATVGELALVSNRSRIDWGTGRRTTELSLNRSPRSGFVGEPAGLVADLVDLASEPHQPVEGALVTFSLAGQECQVATDAEGRASCVVTPPAAGELTLVATFAGDAERIDSSASVAFTVGDFGGPGLLFADDFETCTDDWSLADPAWIDLFCDGFEAGSPFFWSTTFDGTP